MRLDDRLIHGQVIVGWANTLDLERLVVVDDTLRENEWEQDIYRIGIPDELEVVFTSVEEARAQIASWASDNRKTMLITGEVGTLLRLCHESVLIHDVNVGGVHRAEGRSERLPYVFLTDSEYEQLRELQNWSINVTAQDLPSTNPVALEALR